MILKALAALATAWWTWRTAGPSAAITWLLARAFHHPAIPSEA